MTPSDYAEAARCYEQVALWQQAAYQYEAAQQVDEAIRCWQHVPDNKQIARLLARMKQHQAAAQSRGPVESCRVDAQAREQHGTQGDEADGAGEGHEHDHAAEASRVG